MDQLEQQGADRRSTPLAADGPPAVRPPLDDPEPAVPPGEFRCPGCGQPLAITLRSDMCFAEAQVYCADCERDFQERRGRWAE